MKDEPWQVRNAAQQAEAAVKAQVQAQEASDRADAQARIAQVQALSALALANLQNRPDHYSLLGIEAFRQLDNLQSRGALLTALEASRGIRQRLYGHTDDVNTVSFSSDGQLMASGSDDGSVAIWNMSDPDAPTQVGTVPPLDPENPAWVSTIEFQPGESLLAVGYGGGNQVTLWDVSDPGDPQMIADPLTRENALTVSSMAFSRSGILAAAFDDYDSDHSIVLWDLSGAGGPELLGSMAMATCGQPCIFPTAVLARER
jgi:WD40 repeat protein